jgi:hypothetical protein
VESLDLLAKQVKARLEVRMPFGAVCLVVEMPVMALGKDCHAVDVGCGQRVGELLRIKLGPDVRDGRTGVEVKVDRPPGEARSAIGDHL